MGGIITMELLLNGKNCIFNNQNTTELILKQRNIGKYEQLNHQKEYTQFLQAVKIKYHRQFYLDKNINNNDSSIITEFVNQKLGEIGYSQETLHFVSKLLEDDANKRFDAEQALNHPFITNKY